MTLNEWQIGEIKEAIAEADQGDFASDKEVEQSLKNLLRVRYRENHALVVPEQDFNRNAKKADSSLRSE